jgi:hypothetical protein
MITIPIFSFQDPPTRIFWQRISQRLSGCCLGNRLAQRLPQEAAGRIGICEKLGQSFGLFGSFWVRFFIF